MTPSNDTLPQTLEETEHWQLNFYQSIHDIPVDDWNLCADSDYPMLSHGYLSSLEDSRCVNKDRGIFPNFLTVRYAETGDIAAVIPGYVKYSSIGELGADYAWNNYYRGPAKSYYPKYQIEVPFAPVKAPKFLINPGCHNEIGPDKIFRTLCRIFENKNVSSVHMTYADRDQVVDINGLGIIHQTHLQFHWVNKEYEHFDDFLARLNSKYRHAIKRERRQVQAAGCEFINVEGPNISPAQLDLMYELYSKTNKEYNEPLYLNRQFFELIRERIPENIVLFLALENGKPIAANFVLKSANRIFSRYWGSRKFVKFLHFEMSYYRTMEYAIANNVGYFDGGAAGFHKKERGMEPVDIHHLHWVNDPQFHTNAHQQLKSTRDRWQALRDEHKSKSTYRKIK